MIRLRRPVPPSDFDALVQDAREKVRRTLDEAGELKEKDFPCNGWRRFKRAFEGPSTRDTKCMYCEGDPRACASLEMDHYRPKTALTELPPLAASVPRCVVAPADRGTAREVARPGYWWLAYTWENWVLTCERCNGHYKGNLFPCAGGTPRRVTQGCEARESPLLLNPFDDDPEEHLSFDDEGYILAKTTRGAETIRTCGLHRDVLQRARFFVAAHVGELIDAYGEAVTQRERDELLARIRALGASERPFAGMVRSIVWGYLGMPSDVHFFDVEPRVDVARSSVGGSQIP
ncbi:hypothetical protein [Gordonia sp. UBA7599]|uniref:hypothetical protein n=1 Tax=Gordonia sp. UBA7599 TaxID=1946578 RepID=UPI0025B9C63A|nr:hypothetical protein [Gordonia sp. UBA7599]